MRNENKFCHCQFVPNSLSYIPAKYCLSWFTFGKVIAKIKLVNFFLRHRCIYSCRHWHMPGFLDRKQTQSQSQSIRNFSVAQVVTLLLSPDTPYDV